MPTVFTFLLGSSGRLASKNTLILFVENRVSVGTVARCWLGRSVARKQDADRIWLNIGNCSRRVVGVVCPTGARDPFTPFRNIPRYRLLRGVSCLSIPTSS
jgi:hypothetical protein